LAGFDVHSRTEGQSRSLLAFQHFNEHGRRATMVGEASYVPFLGGIHHYFLVHMEQVAVGAGSLVLQFSEIRHTVSYHFAAEFDNDGSLGDVATREDAPSVDSGFPEDD